MGDYKRDLGQDSSMDCQIWGTDDISDEELLREFEAVKHMTVPLPGVEKEDVCEKRPGLLHRIFRFLKREK